MSFNLNSKPNTPLRSSERRRRRLETLRKQTQFRTGALLIIILLTAFSDVLFFKSGLMHTKGVAIGASLNWLSHTIFTAIVFKYPATDRSKGVVNRLYLGLLVKWFILIVGFGATFLLLSSTSAFAVILGFIMMQLLYFLSLWILRSNY